MQNEQASQTQTVIEQPEKKPRMYQPIWQAVIDKANSSDNSPIKVKIQGLEDNEFRRIRKAFYKERDLDTVNRERWRAKVWRDLLDSDTIWFTVTERVETMI